MAITKSTDPSISTPFWSYSFGEAFQAMESKPNGLTDDLAAARLRQYGPNRLKKASNTSSFMLFLLQFRSPITLLLIGAAALSFALSDAPDAFIIISIVLISAILGWWQEKGATNAISQLIKMVQIHCRVLRQDEERELSLDAVVPGDVVLLSAGDLVPGDGLLLECCELFVDEAAFTGETYPVDKAAGEIPIDTPLSKRINTLFMGSHVISGTGKLLIIRTGSNTEFGKISEKLKQHIPETDFERGIRKFGYLLMEITLILMVLIFAINVLLHKPVLDSFLFSLALAVGLTPQLLPAIITVNLAKGARAMANHKVIVKRLSSIENFGSMDILCSDKTGTITEGKVTVNSAISTSGKESTRVMHYARLNASFQKGFRNPIDSAIIAASKQELEGYVVQSEVPYDFIRKRLTVQLKNETENIIITKGAFNQIVQICNRAETETGELVDFQTIRNDIQRQFIKLSEGGYRTLAVAYKPGGANDATREDEYEMIFLGFITLFDPPKPNVKETIDRLGKLGVSLKIITGDNAAVTISIANKIGIKDPQILTGPQLKEMSDAALIHQSSLVTLFAEVEPNQKERIILSLKKAGHVVGFMGDGINDASALHCSDVGISVDSAVDVAKEAADIVLLQSDLNVLVDGILEGRKTFANTMKYIFMATSANFGNMFSMAGASIFLPFLPLLPKQILLTNLMTDLPEMTIATDRIDEITISKPHRWDIKFIQRFMITFGILSSIFDFITFALLLLVLHTDERHFQTGWFVESVISASLIVLVIRTRLPFAQSLPGKYLFLATTAVVMSVLALPYFGIGKLFNFIQLPFEYYIWMTFIVLSYVVCAEFVKKQFYRMWMKSHS